MADVDNLDDYQPAATPAAVSAKPSAVDNLDDYQPRSATQQGQDMGIIPKSSAYSSTKSLAGDRAPLDENGALAGAMRALGSVPVSAIGGVYDLTQGRYGDAAGKLAPAALGAASVAFPPIGAGVAGYGLASSLKGLGADAMADAPVQPGPNLEGRTLPSTGQAFQAAAAQAGDVMENAIGAVGSAALGAGSMNEAALARTRAGAGSMTDFASNAANAGAKMVKIGRSPLKSAQGGLQMAADALRQTPPTAPAVNPNAIPLDTFQRGPVPTRPQGLAPGDQLFTPDAAPTSTFDRSPASTRPTGLAPGDQLFTPEPPATSTFQGGPAPARAPEPSQFTMPGPVNGPQPPPTQTGAPLFARSPGATARPAPSTPFQFKPSGAPPQTLINMDLAAAKPKPFGTPVNDAGGAANAPPIQPWVADQLPAATQGLSQVNQQALMEILNRKPNMTTVPMDLAQPSTQGPAAVAAGVPDVKPTVSLSQIARLLDKVQNGEMSRKDMLGMEYARVKGGKALKDLPIGKGFSRPGSTPPLDMDESLWNDAREYGKQGR